MSSHPGERLSAWLDGEVGAEERALIENHLRACTECAREAAILREIGGAMRGRTAAGDRPGMWTAVHRRITRPLGWLLILTGAVIWAALGVYEWWRAEVTPEWLAGSAAVIGVSLLLVGIGYEQYQEWKETRYKDIQQ